MLLPKIALHGASPLLLLYLLVLQETVFASSFCFYDTVYLNRNGKEIKRIPAPATNVTRIVRTTYTTDDLYGSDSSQINHWQRGVSHPISKAEAKRTERLIKEGKYKEAWQTGNLIELRPLDERRADGRLMQLDNGNGKDREGNNREYASLIFADGTRKDIVGGITDPNGGDPEILIQERKKVIRYSHSHPSGTHETDHILHSFYPQAPSKGDIEACKGEIAVIFGRDTDKVYIYDSTGVIATLPTKAYIRL
ncbi:MAG TPA: hypothetical protein VL832_01590 [Puia sp.]|jgi:hypothetical protein|nr:hypothetical protein [Puia sp.]